MIIIRIADCTGAVLCGGKSSRMGFDKAFLPGRDGHSLLRQNACGLAEVFEQVALVSNTKEKLADASELAGFPVWADHYPGQGPLGGISTALEEAGTPYIFVMACDMPQPDFSLVRQLWQQLDGAQVGLCRHGDKLEPLFAFYHKSCLPVFQAQLAEGRLKLRQDFDKFTRREMQVSPAAGKAAFLNLNTPRQLESWQSQKGLLQVPQMVMIGAFGRNSGKTTLARELVAHWQKQWTVWGLKVVTVHELGGKCHRGGDGCGMCSGLTKPYEWTEETDPVGSKDTNLLLAAGAKRVFLMRGLKNALAQGIEAFMKTVPPDVLLVCESNTLRQFVRPGVFIFAGRPDGPTEMKPSARAVMQWADGAAQAGTGAYAHVDVTINPKGRVCARPAASLAPLERKRHD